MGPSRRGGRLIAAAVTAGAALVAVVAVNLSLGATPRPVGAEVGLAAFDPGLPRAVVLSSMGRPCHAGVVGAIAGDVYPGATYGLWRRGDIYQLAVFSAGGLTRPIGRGPTLIAAFEGVPGRAPVATCTRGLLSDPFGGGPWSASL